MTDILLVEDDAKLAQLMCAYLEKQGYQVQVEARGDNAVHSIISSQPDLVVLDIILPGLDGIQVCQSVRADYPGMILMLTALSDDNIHISGLNSGADDYISKPIQPSVLLARIEALLRREQSAIKPSVLQFGQLAINLVTHSVTLSGNLIDLKPKEFQLLAFLASNADRVLNRNNIMRALRGRDHDGVDRTIDLRISYLRKKLKDHIDNPYRIKTIRSKGYVFMAEAWEKG